MSKRHGTFGWWHSGGFLVVLVAVSAAAPVAAQPGATAPPRPQLGADADTNDAAAYYAFGVSRLRQRPEEAAAAFYWAARLDPASPDAFYARRAALLMSDPYRLVKYQEGDRATIRSPDVRRIDSLQLRAMMLDPFFVRRHDDVVAEAYLRELVTRDARQSGDQVNEAALRFVIERYLHNAPAGHRAWINYAEQKFRDAVDDWAIALRRDSKDTHLRAERARALYLLGSFDSARAEMARAIGDARAEDTTKTWYVYESKAQWEFSLGWIYERLGTARAAKEAYQRALMEDLTFYPAHLRLGTLALAVGDTAGALLEMARAVQARDDEYDAHLQYGFVLDAARRYDSAAAHFRRAGELEPFAATAQFLLARSLDAAGDAAGAAGAYDRCARLSKRDDRFGGMASRRAAALRASAPAAPRRP